MSEHRLSEIVIERPRSGMRISSTKLTGYQKELNRITREATEDGLLSPYLIKTRDKSKWLSDHMGPLRRLLRSHLNQPWDKVYSKLCRELNPRTMAGQHVIDHLWDFVALHVEIIGGMPYSKPNGWLCGGYQPLAGSYRTKFYVHPDTGLLCAVPLVARKQKSQPKLPKDTIDINAYEQYRQINDIWYRIAFEPFRAAFVWDVLIKDTIDAKQALRTYGHKFHAVSKRQCGKRELKKIREIIKTH